MNDQLRVNGKRLIADLEELSRIGGTQEGGVHRPALSEADLETRRWLGDKARAAGLMVTKDGVGNIFMALRAASPSAPTVLFGSHLDSVPNGGRFDGALGVVAALEVLRTVQEAHLALPYHLEGVSFTDEEGTWGGLLGSRALAGLLTPEEFERPRGDVSVFRERMAAAGLTPTGALQSGRGSRTIKAWVEAHIEQGPRLEERGIPIGVVTEIVGIASGWLIFEGRADHAGTTPLPRRRDALQGAAEFVRRSRELVLDRFEGGVVNCGMVKVHPGAFNIVPREVQLALEFRHSNPDMLNRMRDELFRLAREVAAEQHLGLAIDEKDLHQPVRLNEEVMGAIEKACQTLGLASTRLASFAGHDTQVMASLTRAGMFFVPSVRGMSHSPEEQTREPDCVNAGNVLLHSVLGLAG